MTWIVYVLEACSLPSRSPSTSGWILEGGTLANAQIAEHIKFIRNWTMMNNEQLRALLWFRLWGIVLEHLAIPVNNELRLNGARWGTLDTFRTSESWTETSCESFSPSALVWDLRSLQSSRGLAALCIYFVSPANCTSTAHHAKVQRLSTSPLPTTT